MGSQNLYRTQTRGATPLATTKTPMPPDRMTGFNPGPWNHHHGLSSLVCTMKAVCNLLNRTLCRKHVAARRENERDRDLTHVETGVHGWHRTGMLQQYQPATHHVTTWSYHHKNTSTSKLTCLGFACIITLTAMHINMPWTDYSMQTCKTLIISKVQTCLPGSEKSEPSSAKYASPLLLPVSTY